MQKISTLVLLCAMCFGASNIFAQHYFRMDHGKQINFHASGARFITTTTGPVSITAPYNLSPGLTIDSTISLGKTGFALLKVRQNAAFTAGQLHKAGRLNGRFKYITPILLTEEGNEIGSLTDRIMVKLNDNVDLNQINELLSKAGATIAKKYEFDKNVYFVQLPPDSVNFACEIAWRFMQTGLFQYAEPDYLFFVKKTTIDPLYNNQWALNNTGQNGGTPGADIKAVQAWGITAGCNNIRVAVVDEGVDLTHPDLQANLLPGFDATGGGTAGGAENNDAHGTACAGIIGAVANNNIGITGIAYNCRIIPVRSLTATSSRFDIATANALAAGIDWARLNNADVISCSWRVEVGQAAIESAIANAVTSGRGNLGAVICVATGNDNASTITFPSSVPTVIAVGASSPCDQRKSPTSCDGENWGGNFGTGLDVAAPGVLIQTTDLHGANGYTANDYAPAFNGTSAATPHVAATIALILSVNPNLTGVQARQLLESTTDKVGGYSYTTVSGQPNGTWSSDMGYGRINAYRALLATIGMNLNGPAAFCSSTTGTYTIVNAPANLDVTWTVSAGLQINSGQHTPTLNVSGISRGAQTVQASFSSICGTPIVLSQPVFVNDVPIIVGGYYNSNNVQVPLSTTSVNNVCLTSRITNMSTDMTILNNPTSVVWEFDFISPGLIWGQTGNNLNLTFRSSQTGDFIITASNSCGSSDKFYSFKGVSCPSVAATIAPAADLNIQITPNPADGMLRITTNNTNPANTAVASQGTGGDIQKVMIYDLAGRLVKKMEYSNKSQQVEVNTADMHPGVYIIELFNGKSISRKKVIIQR
jgi:subtilisin family serine protease